MKSGLLLVFYLSSRVKFIPVIYRQTSRERREDRITYMNDVYVIEIAVKAGEKGELYETGKHEVEQKCLISSLSFDGKSVGKSEKQN